MNRGKIPCDICGAVLKDPLSENHITSKAHQEALNKGLGEGL